MDYTLDKANNYIKLNSKNTIEEYRQTYHVMAPVGWINDPNGFIQYKNEYHLFYQYHPYSTQHGPMHWGHVKSDDMISWEHLPVALAPDTEFDKDGCFSGSAIEVNDTLYLMYTGNIQHEDFDKNRQIQCIATSKDGVHFEKIQENPVLTEQDLPDNAVVQDFRDPKVFEKNGVYYTVIASQTKTETGQIVLYESSDMINWQFKSVLLEGTAEQGVMWECPDLFELDGKDVLILSPIRITKKGNNFHNISSCVVFIGEVDWETGEFTVDSMNEIDHGMDFYAPQTTSDNMGRRIMVAWMQMWNRPMITDIENHGWAGCMTLPRELRIENDRLIQKPIREIGHYETETLTLENLTLVNESKELEDINGEIFALHLNLDLEFAEKFEISLRKNTVEETTITYCKKNAELTFDRTRSGFEIIGKEDVPVLSRKVECQLVDNQLQLDIYVDKSSIEVFAQDGKETFTSTIYPLNKAEGISFTSVGTTLINKLEKSAINQNVKIHEGKEKDLGVGI